MTTPSAALADGHYDQYVEWKSWDNLFSFSDVENRYFRIETAGISVADADLLEIGFGAGHFLAWARHQGARVSGTELQPALAEAAEAAGIRLLAPAIETCADAFAGAFDTIVSFDVFEHFPLSDLGPRLDACHTMLRPGGHLLLRFPNGQSPIGLTQQHGDPTHLVPLSLAKLRPLLMTHGWEIVAYRGQAIVGGGSLLHKAVRSVRQLLRRIIEATYQFIYCVDHPLDAVVVLVLRKRGSPNPHKTP
ncbi:Cyclopropane-fatty-acyl-phospholipid [Parvularcula bermudensis HTCC2503]|uniref:Cyclopropane-fatty-acyl-phospholipid n=1 Tax=Parvularcula bermudensis (strain ATCC BAA-594 / HTCC2503 / KCTC 12087) TaxID=314260 RepID=E0TC50_PARBH|nr:class I SAM-dependent methyltransferase [Parvularcula bermudensis]ADM10308.1 Cyclopropane-fatty-acyl-phospholipid [Parvularcula bermudensis HTCC2503]